MFGNRNWALMPLLESRAWPDAAELIGGVVCDRLGAAYLEPLFGGCIDIDQWIAAAMLLFYAATWIGKRF